VGLYEVASRDRRGTGVYTGLAYLGYELWQPKASPPWLSSIGLVVAGGSAVGWWAIRRHVSDGANNTTHDTGSSNDYGGSSSYLCFA
jgi:hypothetical protein